MVNIDLMPAKMVIANEVVQITVVKNCMEKSLNVVKYINVNKYQKINDLFT